MFGYVLNHEAAALVDNVWALAYSETGVVMVCCEDDCAIEALRERHEQALLIQYNSYAR